MDSINENSDSKRQESKFDSLSNALPQHVWESIKTGLEQYEKGEGISAEEFFRRHFREDLSN